MRKLPFFIFGSLVIGMMASCHKEDIGLTDDSIFQSNKDDILNYATTKSLSGTMTASGVYYAVKKPSSSTISPANGMEVEYNYTISMLSRSTSTTAVTDVFVDSTYATKSSYSYITATNPGLTEGLLRMHEGDQSIILLPSIYAFGRTGTANGVIPPNTSIRLDVTLKRARTEDQQINEYLTANKLTPSEVTTSGLRFIKTTTNSTGATPTANQTLMVRYNGRLLRSQSAFDSTGTGTVGFRLGGSIPGFDEGLAKLKVGEKAIFVFPSKIGYGTNGYQTIPPYAPLRFDVELVSVQ